MSYDRIVPVENDETISENSSLVEDPVLQAIEKFKIMLV